jgi:L-ascorbate metabolism protein UlaG (beta-lactamase superfamily)
LEISSLLDKQHANVKYQEAGWYQLFHLSEDVEVIFLPAKHWNRRGLTDYNITLWGSFLLRWNDKKIYFAGDSAYDIHFQEIRELLGDMDICIMPVGAYKPPFMMKEAHMNPAEAIQAFHDLGGKVFIPMHYGTYDLSDEPLGEPLSILENMEKSGKIDGKLKAMTIGEIYYLSE